MHNVKCIKCNEMYESKDIDPYYCKSCNIAKIEIAKGIDAKFKNRKPKPMSSLQKYNSINKGGFVNANQML